MKTLRKWIVEQRNDVPDESWLSEGSSDWEDGHREGWLQAMDSVLAELKAREDAEQEQEADRDLTQLVDAVQDHHRKVWVALLELKHAAGFGAGQESEIANGAHAHLNQAFDAVCKIKVKVDGANWRKLLREVLVGDTTMDERADLMRDMGIERKGDADRVNENVKALDGYAGEVLDEKEGGAG